MRAPQRLRGVLTLLGVEVASGIERSNWRFVSPTGPTEDVGMAESSKIPKQKEMKVNCRALLAWCSIHWML